MTDKKLRHLSKSDLIDIIVLLKKNEADMLSQIEAANAKLNEQNQKLSQCQVNLEKVGSIAEESIAISGVFEAAQKAADNYLRKVYESNHNIEERCALMIRETENKCKLREAETDRIIKEKWMLLQKKVREYIQAHEELADFLK